MSVLSPSAGPSPAPGKVLPPELQKAMSRVTEISSLPDVTACIVAVVEDPRATSHDVHQAVKTDPALATRILKIVNSAFYGLPSQVASLDRAILMLGLSAVKNLALAASLSRLLTGAQITDEFSTRDLWRHSVAVGVAAKLLARAAKYPQADEAMVTGLVHDMGLILAQQLFPAQMSQVVETCFCEPQSFVAAEERILGADHQVFGGALAAKWKFPPGVRHAITYHHEPSSLQPEFQKLAAIVYLADTLCCQGRFGLWVTGQTQEPAEWMLKLIGLSAESLTQVAEELPERLDEAEQIFTAR
jgi:HD-like signal output (HDOD) protein